MRFRWMPPGASGVLILNQHSVLDHGITMHYISHESNSVLHVFYNYIIFFLEGNRLPIYTSWPNLHLPFLNKKKRISLMFYDYSNSHISLGDYVNLIAGPRPSMPYYCG